MVVEPFPNPLRLTGDPCPFICRAVEGEEVKVEEPAAEGAAAEPAAEEAPKEEEKVGRSVVCGGPWVGRGTCGVGGWLGQLNLGSGAVCGAGAACLASSPAQNINAE